MSILNKLNVKSNHLQRLGFIAGIVSAVVILLLFDLDKDNPDTTIMAAVAVLMSIWWITEAVPLAATSLVPLILFPAMGVLSGNETASAYINSTIFLFMGGFIIAIAMENWNLHKRIALHLISFFGKSPSKIILGFMIASAFMSMWISNTATAVMLLPIGLAILYKLEDQFGTEKTKTFSISLMLAIAYSCSIGGIATIIGTPPNLVFQRIYAISFPDNPEILFGEWMFFALPLAVIMLICVWFILTKFIYKPDSRLIIDARIIKEEKSKLGRMTFEEKAVMIVFIITAFLWIFRKELDIGIFTIPGWSNLFPNSDFIDDGTVAIAVALILFVIPVRSKDRDEIAILNISVFRKIPWEIILLFGGGFALAKGFVSSGLSDLVGAQFSGLAGVPVIFIIGAICLTITFLTELTSNTATAQIILPILASLSIHLDINPLLLMIPATISASMAFMMPVATPPNAIVFGSQRLKVYQMAKAGIIFNLLGAVLITLFVNFIFS